MLKRNITQKDLHSQMTSPKVEEYLRHGPRRLEIASSCLGYNDQAEDWCYFTAWSEVNAYSYNFIYYIIKPVVGDWGILYCIIKTS